MIPAREKLQLTEQVDGADAGGVFTTFAFVRPRKHGQFVDPKMHLEEQLGVAILGMPPLRCDWSVDTGDFSASPQLRGAVTKHFGI